MPDQMPAEGQYFQLHPIQAPKPKPGMSWGLPIALGLLAVPLLMFGFGVSQQQKPAESAPSPSATPETQPSPLFSPAPVQATTPSATPEIAPTPIQSVPQSNPLIDAAQLPTATIRAIGVAANFRTAPSLHSQILGVLMNGDLVQLTTDRRVSQDGVVWVPVRYRGANGWVAQSFIGGSSNAQP